MWLHGLALLADGVNTEPSIRPDCWTGKDQARPLVSEEQARPWGQKRSPEGKSKDGKKWAIFKKSSCWTEKGQKIVIFRQYPKFMLTAIYSLQSTFIWAFDTWWNWWISLVLFSLPVNSYDENEQGIGIYQIRKKPIRQLPLSSERAYSVVQSAADSWTTQVWIGRAPKLSGSVHLTRCC